MCEYRRENKRGIERERASGREENMFVQYLFTVSSNSKHRKKNSEEKRSRRRKHSNALISSLRSMDRAGLRGQPVIRAFLKVSEISVSVFDWIFHR